PGRDPRLAEPVVQAPEGGSVAVPLLLDRLDRLPERDDPILQVLLLGLEGQRRLHERRSFLRRVADPRALREELCRDQEAEDEEGAAQGQLPGRNRPEPGGDRGHGRSSDSSAGEGGGGGRIGAGSVTSADAGVGGGAAT